MKSTIAKYFKYLNFPLDDLDINQILVYLENKQIKKLHFEYGTTILLISLEHSEYNQDFYLCAAIKKFIEELNKYSEEDIPTNLKLWIKKNTLTE